MTASRSLHARERRDSATVDAGAISGLLCGAIDGRLKLRPVSQTLEEQSGDYLNQRTEVKMTPRRAETEAITHSSSKERSRDEQYSALVTEHEKLKRDTLLSVECLRARLEYVDTFRMSVRADRENISHARVYLDAWARLLREGK